MKTLLVAIAICALSVPTHLFAEGILIKVIASPNEGESTVVFSGQETHIITDEERTAFGIGLAASGSHKNQKLHDAVHAFCGKEPHGAWVHKKAGDPDLYKKYGFVEVTATLKPVKAEIIDFSSESQVAINQCLINASSTPSTQHANLTTSKTDTVETNWTQTHTFSFSEAIKVEAGVPDVASTSAEYTLGFEDSYGTGGSDANAVSVGIETGNEEHLEAGQAKIVQMTSNLGKLRVKVTYDVTLNGHVAVHYSSSYACHGKNDKHYYYGFGITDVLKEYGKPQKLTSVQDLYLDFYSTGNLVVYDAVPNEDNTGCEIVHVSADPLLGETFKLNPDY